MQLEGQTSDTMRILFVDDEPDVRSGFARSMKKHGFDVDVASNGIEAIARAQDCFYPVILTDLRMPGMDGMTLIRKLCQITPNSAFIVVTAVPELDLRRDDVADSAIVSIVAKPWDDMEMATIIRKASELHINRTSGLYNVAALQSGKQLRVLMIEDDDVDAELITDYLDLMPTLNAEVSRVGRLNDALKLAHLENFDLAIVDLTLPDARGLDVVMRLRTAVSEAALIVLTGIDDDALGLQAVKLGAQDFIVKSRIERHTLERAIRYALERKRSEQRLVQLAHYDHLTELSNRATFNDRLQGAIARSRRRRESFAIMFVDLDRFKNINDTMGHEAGDRLLCEIARRLQSSVRDCDVVARLGGDEFAILLEGPWTQPELVAQRIVKSLGKAITLGDESVAITGSIGIAIYPQSGQTCAELLSSADTAMYQAKSNQRGTFQVFRGTNEQKDNGLFMESRLRQAAEEKSFHLNYQPQIDLQSNRVIGFEALIRWDDPENGLVRPNIFVPKLEDMGLIQDVTLWVVDTACEQLRRWHTQGNSGLEMAVNLSAHDFSRNDLADQIIDILRIHKIPSDCLVLEITEGILMKNRERINANLTALRAHGVRIAIDDFGTGYSSLSYLHRFSVTELKIDKSFIQAIGRDENGESIVAAIISLGQKLGLEIIAEGIENTKQLEFLRNEGCTLGQGYLFGRPASEWNGENFWTEPQDIKPPRNDEKGSSDRLTRGGG